MIGEPLVVTALSVPCVMSLGSLLSVFMDGFFLRGPLVLMKVERFLATSCKSWPILALSSDLATSHTHKVQRCPW